MEIEEKCLIKFEILEIIGVTPLFKNTIHFVYRIFTYI